MTVSRRGGREKRVAGAIRQLPFARLVNPYTPIGILSDDQVEAIIDGAFTILETRGMRFLEPGSRKLLAAAGAELVDEAGTMHIDRGLVKEKLALVPREFGLRARNRDHDIFIGGRNLVFASVGGPAFVNDLDKGRRPGTHAEVCRASISSTRSPAGRSRRSTCRPSRATSTSTSRR
jgi:trimethylamine--corrinoid protein Co-methyltransferase